MKIILIIFVFLHLGCVDKGKCNLSLFADDLISTQAVEYGASFSQDFREVFFVRSSGDWGKGPLKGAIYYSKQIDGRWSTPEIVPFSGDFDDGDPHLTKYGTSLYFTSDRPSKAKAKSMDIWRVNRLDGNKWGKPQRLPDHINTAGAEYSPKTTANGDLYFAATRSEGFGQGDLYMSAFENDKFTKPVNLGPIINSHMGEWNLGISEDGKLLIYEASQRPTNKSSYGDLYISFKREGQWTIPQSIIELNTTGSDLYPELFESENKLFYSSSDTKENTDVNIYVSQFGSLLQKYKQSAQLARNHILVVNRSAHSISVIDLQTKQLVREYQVGRGPHEMSISHDRRYVFVANYGFFPKPHVNPITSKQLEWEHVLENTLSRISLADGEVNTFKLTDSDSPHGILTNADGSKVWTTAENDGLVRELDGNTGSVIHDYQAMKGSHVIVGKRDRSMLFVSNIQSNTVSIINTKTKEVQHFDTPKGPEGIHLSEDESELWVLSNSDNMVSVYNLERGRITHEFPAGGKFPVKMTFVNEEVWISNVPTRNITIFDANNKAFKEVIKLESTPLGITSSDNRVYITLPRKNLIQVFDAKTRELISSFSVGMEPDGMLVMQDLEQVFK